MYSIRRESTPSKMTIDVRSLLCDSESFQPFRRLIEGPLEPDDLPLVERFVRAIVLHDSALLKPDITITIVDGGEAECHIAPPELNEYGLLRRYAADTIPMPNVGELFRAAIVATEASLAQKEDHEVTVEGIDRLLPNLIAVAFGAGLSAGYLVAGGSVLISNGTTANDEDGGHGPEALFGDLDTAWQEYARASANDGFGLLVPPVLGILTARCARRDAIPAVLADLRQEWSSARRKVWELLEALRKCSTLAQGIEIRDELAQASRLFVPQQNQFQTRPIRVFWDITAGIAAGALITAMSGGKPVIGAITGGVGQAARSVPSLLNEFGPSLFGRGAFDLARRIRREIPGIERDSLARLLSSSERQKFGFK